METNSSFTKGCVWGLLLSLPFWVVIVYLIIRFA